MTLGREQSCPACGRANDAAMPAPGVTPDSAVPHAGDATICFGCATWLIFTDDDLSVRAATPSEIAELEADPANRRVQQAVATKPWRHE